MLAASLLLPVFQLDRQIEIPKNHLHFQPSLTVFQPISDIKRIQQ